MYACLAVTCHLHFWQNDRDFLRATVVTRGWNGYRNKSQHRKSTPEKKILPPFQQGFEPATFQSRVRCSNHWAIPAPQLSSKYTSIGFIACLLFHLRVEIVDLRLLIRYTGTHFYWFVYRIFPLSVFTFHSESLTLHTGCYTSIIPCGEKRKEKKVGGKEEEKGPSRRHKNTNTSNRSAFQHTSSKQRKKGYSDTQ